MKTYTFTTSNINNSKKNFIDEIIGKSKYTNYSKTIDDIIFSDVMKKNPYLFTDTDLYITRDSKEISSDFLKAAEFLANYKKPENKLNIIIGHTYYLSNNTPIIFYDDEIQIGFDVFKYSDFSSDDFINAITPKMKKTIIDIYTNSRNLTININL
jgi:hypothetical protein